MNRNNNVDVIRRQHRNLLDAGLHVYAYEGVAATEIIVKGVQLIILGTVYGMAADVRAKQHTTEYGRYEETLAMLLFSLQFILFQAIFTLYLWIAVLSTRVQSRMRSIHLIIAFLVVLPLGFIYLYYSNCEVLVMLVEEDTKSQPAAKHPSLFLIIVFWLMVGNCAVIFLMLNLLLLCVGVIAVYLYNDWHERTAEERSIRNVLNSLKRKVSRVFGDKECVICAEEFQDKDQVV